MRTLPLRCLSDRCGAPAGRGDGPRLTGPSSGPGEHRLRSRTAPAHVISEAAGAITGGASGGGNPCRRRLHLGCPRRGRSGDQPCHRRPQSDRELDLLLDHGLGHRGATWLIGQLVNEIEKSTHARTLLRGIPLRARDGADRAALAGASALLAILEALAQSSWAHTARAFLATCHSPSGRPA